MDAYGAPAAPGRLRAQGDVRHAESVSPQPHRSDLRDGTSIYDIKPYIPFADCHPEASGGWIDRAPWQELEVDFPEDLQARVPASKLAGLIEVLRQDPRRAGSKHEPERVYHLAYAGIDVSFTVDIDTLHVVETIPSA